MNDLIEMAKKNPWLAVGGVLVALSFMQNSNDGGQAQQIRDLQRNAILEERKAEVSASIALSRFQQNPICAYTFESQLPRGIVDSALVVDPTTGDPLPDNTVLADHYGVTAVTKDGRTTELARTNTEGNLKNPCRIASGTTNDNNLSSQNQEAPVQSESEPSGVPVPGISGLPSDPQ